MGEWGGERGGRTASKVGKDFRASVCVTRARACPPLLPPPPHHRASITQRAWWRDAKLMLFAVALSLNLPGCTRDDPNTRALSSSHYGYVPIPPSVFSARERAREEGEGEGQSERERVSGTRVHSPEEREGEGGGRWRFPRGGWQVGWVTIGSIVAQWHRPRVTNR